ncbi:MAG TPA: RNA polymerase sporulation sigma factor SigK [Firmicutes bacterium]|nr:RNA polymerase sporulation sigma factor SigK [Bacillota bacterium]
MVFESFLAFLSKVFCFSAYIKNNGSFPKPLSPEDEKKYLELCREGDREAREILIRHNLRLVAHIVKKYSGAGEADDLISVGSIGLIKGIQTFEYGRGSQLATYAARCIENEILMYIRANKKHRNDVSLSESVGSDKDGNDITLIDVLSVPADSVLEEAENKILMEKIRACVAELPDRERTIITMRYGLGGGIAYTQLEVAKKLKISRSYVSRIEKKVLAKISAKLNN